MPTNVDDFETFEFLFSKRGRLKGPYVLCYWSGNSWWKITVVHSSTSLPYPEAVNKNPTNVSSQFTSIGWTRVSAMLYGNPYLSLHNQVLLMPSANQHRVLNTAFSITLSKPKTLVKDQTWRVLHKMEFPLNNWLYWLINHRAYFNKGRFFRDPKKLERLVFQPLKKIYRYICKYYHIYNYIYTYTYIHITYIV